MSDEKRLERRRSSFKIETSLAEEERKKALAAFKSGSFSTSLTAEEVVARDPGRSLHYSHR